MTAPADRPSTDAAAWVDDFTRYYESHIGPQGAPALDVAEGVAAARVIDVLVERDVVAEADLAVVREVRRRRREAAGA